MLSMLTKNKIAVLALLTIVSATAFADFGDDSARLYCQVTCKGVKQKFGSFPLEKGLNYGLILGLWTDSGFATNQGQYDAVTSICQTARYDILREDPLSKKIRFDFIKADNCAVKPLALAWYNPVTTYEISVMRANE